jgi:hypothetical protein
MIYSYNKSQQDALILNFILVKNSSIFNLLKMEPTVFRNVGFYYSDAGEIPRRQSFKIDITYKVAVDDCLPYFACGTSLLRVQQ